MKRPNNKYANHKDYCLYLVETIDLTIFNALDEELPKNAIKDIEEMEFIDQNMCHYILDWALDYLEHYKLLKDRK